MLLLLSGGQVVADDIFGSKQEFLPADEAFVLQSSWVSPGVYELRWDIADGYYLYRDRMQFVSEGLGEAHIPEGKSKQDEYFGRVQVFHNQVVVRLPQRSDAPERFQLQVVYQGCAEAGLCYPPQKRLLQLWRTETATAGSDAGGMAADQQVVQRLVEGHMLWNLLVFFGLGLLLALTPCVLPMVPILSGILAGSSGLNTRRGFSLALVYVLAMALVYALAGALTAQAGASLQALLQTPWVLVPFAAIFVLLAGAMFGLYPLQMPTFVQTRLSRWSEGRSRFPGAALMGGISALIVGPCVTAPLVGVLLYIAQTGDALFGGLALFSLGLGIGAPLILLGIALGHWLPRAGSWMQQVNRLFGFILLGTAIWLLERVLPTSVALALWGLLLALVTAWLFGLRSLPEVTRLLIRALGLVAAIWALFMFIGAALGRGDLLRPLEGLVQLQQAQREALRFELIADRAALKTALTTSSKPVLLYFFADWCTDCKAMQREVFPDVEVRAALARYYLLRVDVTDSTGSGHVLLGDYGVVGPPSILLFNRSGEELRDRRMVGAVTVAELLRGLRF